MDADSLLRLFDDLTASSEQVPALRRLMFACVLHAALNGPDASMRARALREEHTSQRVMTGRRSSKFGAVTLDELPPALSIVPTNLFDRLENIATIEKGQSQIQSTTPGGHPLVVTAEARSTSDSWHFEGPSAIVPLVSSTGHGDASLKRIHYQEGKYAVGNILAVIQPIRPNAIHARFLYEYLSAFKDELLVARMVGTANVSLTINKLKEVPVPLVSGEALRRIDELMAFCDRLEAEQKEREAKHAHLARAALARFAEAPTPASLDYLFHNAYTIDPANLRKSILTIAVQGKIVPQRSTEGTAENLLNDLTQARSLVASGKRAERARVLREIDDGKRCYEIPDSWSWTRLGDLVSQFRYGTSRKCDRTGKGVPVLRIPNIQGGRINSTDLKFAEMPSAEFNELRLASGDLVLVRSNGSETLVGRCAVAADGDDRFAYAGYLVRARTSRLHMFAPYLQLALSESSVRAQIEGPIRTTSGVKNINTTELGNLVFPLPPLSEQRRIVAKVDALMSLVDRLEAKLAEARAVAGRLMEAVVAELTQARVDRVDVKAIEPREANVARLACYVLKRWGGAQPGRTKLEKAFDFSQTHCGAPLRREATWDRHGPVDYKLLRAAEAWAAERGGFATHDPGDHGKVLYTPDARFDDLAAAGEAFLGERRAEVDRVLDLLATLNTKQCEYLATAYNAWASLLSKDAPAGDRDIIHVCRHEWHAAKETIPLSRWYWALRFLRAHRLTPTDRPG